MTPEQSKQLKVGTRVCFDGDPADSGKVISIEARYVTIKWGDGPKALRATRHIPAHIQSRLTDIGYAKEVLGAIVPTDDGLQNCDGQMTIV
jgi:hypothetical protein